MFCILPVNRRQFFDFIVHYKALITGKIFLN